MSENLKLWNAVCRPPTTALKPIGGGRLKGMTDINPTWRIQAMTEQFGQCGVGWKYTIERMWTEKVSHDQVAAFAEVWVHTKSTTPEVDWSDPIPGVGGSMLVKVETAGLKSDDEAYKMAVTDALSVALKALGVGADIYMGRWDGSKYKDSPPEQQPQPKPEKIWTWGAQIASSIAADDLRSVYAAMPKDQREAWSVEVAAKRKEFGI